MPGEIRTFPSQSFEQATRFQIHIEDDAPNSPASRSDWVLLSDRRESLDKPELMGSAKLWIEVRRDWRLWTDDFNNLVQVLK